MKLFGLDILLVFDSVYGLAYLTENSRSNANTLELCLRTIHSSLRRNSQLNELLMELYSEDTSFKENEVATFTV